MTADTPPPTLEPPAIRRRQLLLVAAATLLCCAYLFVWAVGQQPVLGDEATHVRRAVNYFRAPFPDFRVICDPAFEGLNLKAINYPFYWGVAGWHIALALLWKLIGSPALLAAQLYQSLFVFALGLFTYLAGRELFGHRGGLWAWALVLTFPMNVLFGMVLYLEVPMLAAAAMALYCLLRRQAVLLGLALALMFLIKGPTGAVLIVALLALAPFLIADSWRPRLWRTALALAVLFLLALPDLIWNQVHFGQPIVFRLTPPQYPATILADLRAMPRITQNAALSIFDPRAVLMMFGVSGVAAFLVAAALCLRDTLRGLADWLRAARRQGLGLHLLELARFFPLPLLVLGAPFVFFVVVYKITIPLSYDVRYLQPTTLFIALLTAGLLVRRPAPSQVEGPAPQASAPVEGCAASATNAPSGDVGPRHAVAALALGRAKFKTWLARAAATLLAAACAAQFLVVPLYTHYKLRPLDPTTAAAYDWIRNHTGPHDLFLYDNRGLTLIAERPIIWSEADPRFLFTTSENRQMTMLTWIGARYIAIPPGRPERQAKADPTLRPMTFPEDWIASLARRPYLTLVYPPDYDGNPAGKFLIYRLDYDKIPRDWFVTPPPTSGDPASPQAPSPRAPPSTQRPG